MNNGWDLRGVWPAESLKRDKPHICPQIPEDFPTLTEEDVRAVIAFAAASAEEDLPSPGVPSEL